MEGNKMDKKITTFEVSEPIATTSYQTQHYKFPVYAETDKTNWLGAFNQLSEMADNAIYDVSQLNNGTQQDIAGLQDSIENMNKLIENISNNLLEYSAELHVFKSQYEWEIVDFTNFRINSDDITYFQSYAIENEWFLQTGFVIRSNINMNNGQPFIRLPNITTMPVNVVCGQVKADTGVVYELVTQKSSINTNGLTTGETTLGIAYGGDISKNIRFDGFAVIPKKITQLWVS